MTELEKGQLTYLIERRELLIDNMIGAVEAINQQIKDVKNGTWLRELKESDDK